MHDLDVFRSFRAEIAAPSSDAEARASARLNDAIQRQRRTRAVDLRLRPFAIAFAVIVGATGLALFVSAPWKSSPGFIERAQAALTPPVGTILHQKWVATTTSAEYGCAIDHPYETWADQEAPQRYRALLSLPPPEAASTGRRALACWDGPAHELGGALDSFGTLRFMPPNQLSYESTRFSFPDDPVEELRAKLRTGHAHHEGQTQFDGRTVERIRVDPAPCPTAGCPQEPFFWYVDPVTLHPVGMEGPGGLMIRDQPFLRLDVVVRFLAYDYLPRTPANIALTDIEAQHPDAKRP